MQTTHKKTNWLPIAGLSLIGLCCLGCLVAGVLVKLSPQLYTAWLDNSSVQVGSGGDTITISAEPPSAEDPVNVPRRPNDVSRFALSPTRARIHLAWAPWTELSIGLRSLG